MASFAQDGNAPRAPADDNAAPRVVVKVIVLGSSNVGKTSLMRRFTQGQFTERRQATTGADYLSKRLLLHGTSVVLQIWDTAGQERFHHGTLGAAFYRGSDAAILVYDVTNPNTFLQVERWRSELLERIDSPDSFPCVVFGNKTDAPRGEEAALDRPAVLAWCAAIFPSPAPQSACSFPRALATRMLHPPPRPPARAPPPPSRCRQRGIGHVETSAKDGTGVDAAMEAIALLAVENKRRRPTPEPDRSKKIRLRAAESGDLGAMYSRHPTTTERCGCGSGGIAGAVD